MPIIKSAKKAQRQAIKRKAKNEAIKKEINNMEMEEITSKIEDKMEIIIVMVIDNKIITSETEMDLIKDL